MKTTIKLSIITLLAAFAFASCSKERIKGTGSNVTETFNISDFSKVDLSFGANVNYIYDNNYSVEVDAQENVIDAMDIEKNGSTICLKFRKGTALIKYNKVTFTIRSPQFEGGNVSGSGDVLVSGNFRSKNLNFDVSGSGSIWVQQIETTNVDADISGSGKIEVQNGIATKVNTTISGSGKMLLENLQADNVTTKTSGSGKTTVWAKDKLDVTISGSGDVYYNGNPSITKKISGSGKIHEIN